MAASVERGQITTAVGDRSGVPSFRIPPHLQPRTAARNARSETTGHTLSPLTAAV